jgi:hypothetical protein
MSGYGLTARCMGDLGAKWVRVLTGLTIIALSVPWENGERLFVHIYGFRDLSAGRFREKPYHG